MSRLTDAQKDAFVADGFVRVAGLIPPETVAATRAALLESMGVREDAPDTWRGLPGIVRDIPALRRQIAVADVCRTDALLEAAAELAGPIARDGCYSPYLESLGEPPRLYEGFIPVVSWPVDGPPAFETPTGWHIDGIHRVTLWPTDHALVPFVYLNDVAVHGGATVVRPGSHRQVFAHGLTTGWNGETLPDLPYADPLPIPGDAGDVLFLHYLTVHSGSRNFDRRIRVGLNAAIRPARPWTPDALLAPDTPLARTLAP